MKREKLEAIFFDASGTLFREDSEFGRGVSVFSDAELVLECLRKREFAGRKLRTGLITNWSRRVHHVLESVHMSECFDVVVCVDDVQNGKPNAEPFVLAATSLGVDVSRCVHVGDSLRDDVFGAFDAGLDCLWINRRERHLSMQELRMFQSIGHPHFLDLDEAREYLEQLICQGVR